MIKIVSIVWYRILPARFGGQKGIALFNEHLARLHPLVCLCSKNNVAPPDLPYKVLPLLPVSKNQFLLPSARRTIKMIVAQEKASHVILEHPYHGLAAVMACKATGARLIVHSHNIESERFRQLGNWWWRILQWYETWTHRKADLNLFKTNADMNWAIKHFKLEDQKCMLMPYGVTFHSFSKKENAAILIRKRHDIPGDEKIFLFAGTLDYGPNKTALEVIITEVAPRLSSQGCRYRILVCGRGFDKLSPLRTHSCVTLIGEVDDIENYFNSADVFINPVTTGGGIQTKNLEALSHHCNLVCFDNMIDPLTFQTAERKLFECPPGDWESFTRLAELASHSSEPTPAPFFEAYSWENAVNRLSDHIKTT
jgi:glycosyltransferase involved in cell wall biosynthesis